MPSATPTAAPTASAPPTATSQPSPDPTTAAPTVEPSPAPTSSPTSEPSPSPSPAPTPAPTTAVPSPAPTPVPTRTPIVAVTIGMSGINCTVFDQTIFATALDAVVANSTTAESTCSNTGTASAPEISVATELAAPQAQYIDTHASLLDYVTDVVTASISSGAFEAAIDVAVAASRRRLTTGMDDASVDSVTVSTFSPTPAPTPLPSTPPTPAPTSAPTPAPSGLPTPAPSEWRERECFDDLPDGPFLTDTAFYVFPSTEVRVPVRLQIEFTPYKRLYGGDFVKLRLPRVSRGDLSMTPGDDLEMGELELTPSTRFDGAWSEGAFDHADPYANATLTLQVKPGRFLPAGVRTTVKINEHAGFKVYCGMPANNPNITIRTNASCADEWSTVGATLQVGSGCAALGSCSGAGTCDYCTQKCSCYEGFGAASDLVDAAFNALDCTQRTCPGGPAWGDMPVHRGHAGLSPAYTDGGESVMAHARAECSNAGLCERTAGLCVCFPSFEGDACQRRSCPSGCSGHGRCVTMNALAHEKTALPLGPSWPAVSYGDTTVAESNPGALGGTWDADVLQGCVCDSSWPVGYGAGERQQPEWFGPDCSLRHCPTGDDPRTRRVDETDCSNRTLPSGVTSAPGNKCHVDCSNRGMCDYALGKCTCFEGCEFVFLAAADVRQLTIVASPPILGVQVLRG